MKKPTRYILLAILLLGLIVWGAWENQGLGRTDYTLTSQRLPDSFDGYRIVQISDLHNTRFGKNNEKLLQMVKDAQPDMIAMTGDLIDSRRTDLEIALEFVRAAVKIAPCYYVTGNHEIRDEEYGALEQEMEKLGVTVLRGEKAEVTRGTDKIYILGVDDCTEIVTDNPKYEKDRRDWDEIQNEVMEIMLEPIAVSEFNILLSHRPDSFPVFCRYGVDLALTGHNHGGQIRIPGLGGLYASEELFPEYDEGMFSQGNTAMIVSRGLGNSLFPFRVNNRPEIVVVTLHK